MRSRRKRTLLSFQRPVPLRAVSPLERRRKKASDSRQRPPMLRCGSYPTSLEGAPVARGTGTLPRRPFSGGRGSVATRSRLSSRVDESRKAPLARLQRRPGKPFPRHVELRGGDAVELDAPLLDQAPPFAGGEAEGGGEERGQMDGVAPGQGRL